MLGSRDAATSETRAISSHGARFSVDTDSHAVPHLDLLRYGIATAQRGWLTKDDVINAWPLSKLRRFLTKPAVR